MFAVPDVHEVTAAAKALGIHLGADEAILYQKYLVEQLKALDSFLQSRLEETRPPSVHPERAPGYRPSAEEDPLNAWLWKCDIPGAPEGLLARKTVSFKDHIAVAGIPLTFGSYVMESFVPDFDATVVTRVLEAGGRIVGKNAMNGFTGGFGFGGAIGDYGRPKNPHNPAHVTGGSSSGSGAAVVAGEVDISFGGDQGGSIRIPAAWSGNVGLKPTFGLVSHFGIGFGSDQSIDYTGPMTRSVEDAAAALDAVAGHDGLDPRQGRDVPERLDASSRLTMGMAGMRVGILEEAFESAEDDVRDLVLAAAETMADAGAKVSKVSVPEHLRVGEAATALGAEGSRAVFDTGFFGAFTRTYYPASLIAAVHKMLTMHADVLNPRTKLNYLTAEFSRRNFHGQVYAKAQNVRKSFIKAYDKALTDVDVLLMPTCLMKAPEYDPPTDHLAALEENLMMTTRKAVRNTQPFNYTGHPALAVPCGKSNGLPVSMQLVGRFFDDPLLLRVAYAYEKSVPFADIIAVDAP
ncbi:amidase family protein [Actinopolymorpha pittospori]|uniref:Amidase n=1 Tax=Actinopolymorpha pittospori TaxID=648752 RepID=A0A927RID3_9ACTN|nr:amidase family protein [Actinopolymorpha pittospori]MBE1613170.1 amidase [Actinopolymorpha pittospori]